MLTDTHVANERQSASSCSPVRLASDQDLLVAIADGAVWALDLLYQRYHQGLYSLAYKMVSDHQLAEDLLQETFIRVWRRAATYSPEAGNVRGWLFAILRNQTIDYLRRQRQRTAPKEIPLGEIECDDRVAFDSTWEEVWHHEEQARLSEALGQLTEKQRMVLELSYFQGYTHVEIANICKMPLGTVKSSMRQGLLALKRELMKRGEKE
jgi:RNA polymerase sigma factor (sigma-70 family)